MLYDEILKCYEGETELHANTSFEFGLMLKQTQLKMPKQDYRKILVTTM